jgi:hypothetical protein
LVPKSKPGELDERFAGSAVAGAIDAPIAIHAPALKRRWGKTQIAGDLPPVVEGPVKHLPRQDGGEVHADSADRAKRFDRPARGVVLRFQSLLANRIEFEDYFLGSATAADARGSTLRRDGLAAVAVARSKSPRVGVPRTERRPLPNALGGEQRGDAIFDAHALLHQEFSVGTTTILQASGSPANCAARTRRRPKASSRSVLARRAPRVTNMLVGSTTWLITPCAVRSRCNQDPSARPQSS